MKTDQSTGRHTFEEAFSGILHFFFNEKRYASQLNNMR